MHSPVSKTPESFRSAETQLYSLLGTLLSPADERKVRHIATSICRAVYFSSTAPADEADPKLQLFYSLRSAGVDVDHAQLEAVFDAVLGYNRTAETAGSGNHSADAARSLLSPQEFKTLSQWNADTAGLFDHLAVSSHAGVRSIEALPTDAAAPEPLSKPAVASSSTSLPFSATWLRLRCSTLPNVKSGILTPSEMALSVHALLADTTLRDESIQEHLFDAFGGDFDAVADVLMHRKAIQESSDSIIADCNYANQMEAMDIKPAEPRQRGVAARRGRAADRDKLTAQVTVRDRGKEALMKDMERESRLLAKAGLLPPLQEDDISNVAVSGSAYEERQKAFPGVQMAGDSVIGAIDRVGLPKGSTREMGRGFEEIFVPPPTRNAQSSIKTIEISQALCEHPELLQVMKGVSRLNRLQSAVYPIAFQSEENMLVCAPTGAGKTNVALLTILREIVAVKRREQRSFKVVYVAPMKALAAEITAKFEERLSYLGLRVREFTGDMSLSRSEAMETHILVTTPEKWDVVTRKSGSELGDAVTLFIVDEIHLLHDERGAVLESIVARTLRLSETAQRRVRLVGLSATLPNYADVGSFMRVSPSRGLFHFDGSHRPVPLSQTFIGVSEGGTSNSNEARRRRENKMHELAWKKVRDSLQRGHQAMIFVHSRKGTGKAAREMLSRATQDACEELFLGGSTKPSRSSPDDGMLSKKGSGPDDQASVIPSWAAREISKSKTADIRELCSRGVGIHNAGLPRPDRKLVEKLFGEGIIKLLCCTATLAWGINLPARTVVIMGTEVYNAEKGGFVQLGMLDVMQIFGRAGRPQFDTEGEGIIITMHEHLSKYITMLTSSIPIESKLGASASRLADHLNAEIISGTVSTVGEGVRWLSYTYLSVRMPQNPLVYGINWEEVAADQGLHSRRASLIEQAAKALDDARMCRYDPRTGVLAPTDLGRVSSHFYVSHETIVLWNETLSKVSHELTVLDDDWDEAYAAVIHSVACSTEFEQMRSRQEEIQELDDLMRDACPIPLKAGSESREGKVSILLQAHISRAYIRMSDLSYIVESATRLLRAFFEISLHRGLPSLALASLELARASESRIWPFQHPLWQFTYMARRGRGVVIQPEVVAAIEASDEENGISALRAMSKDQLSVLVRAPRMVPTVQKVLNYVPTLEFKSAKVALLSRTVMSVTVHLLPNFRWNDSIHGSSESWWIWIEDREENRIYLHEKVILSKRQVQSLAAERSVRDEARSKLPAYSFTVPVFDPPSSHYWVRVESDRWHTGRESNKTLSVGQIDLPREETATSTILDLRPLPAQDVLHPEEACFFEKKLSHFTPLQTQAFHTVYHTNENMLISTPNGSGSEVIAELAIVAALRRRPSSAVVVLISDLFGLELLRKKMSDLAAQMKHPLFLLDRWSPTFEKEPDSSGGIILTTPQRWHHVTRTWDDSHLCNTISLLVIYDMHVLFSSEDATTEVLLVRLRHLAASDHVSTQENGSSTPRIVALSERLPNAAQVGEWLGVDSRKGLLHFDHNVREVPSELQVLGVAGDRYTSRMHSVNRPLFSTLQRYSSKKPVLIFVSSRRQALMTGQDLLRMAMLEGSRADFIGDHGKGEEVRMRLMRAVTDSRARRLLMKGVALYHDKMLAPERDAIQELFDCGYAQIMISTFKMARAFDSRCHQVIVKGTERYDEALGRYVDLGVADIQHMIGKAGRAGEDSTAYASIFVHEPKKTLMKKVIHEPLPLESALLKADFSAVLNDLTASMKSLSTSQLMNWFASSLFVRRLVSNPGYYGKFKQNDRETRRRLKAEHARNSEERCILTESLMFCEDISLQALRQLTSGGCIHVGKNASGGDSHFRASSLGSISAEFGITPQSAAYLSIEMRENLSVAKAIDVLCTCSELSGLENYETEDSVWRSLFEDVVREVCVANAEGNREEVAKNMGINGWLDSPFKRTKLLCYSLLIDSDLKIDSRSNVRKMAHETFSRLVAAAFDIASEYGSVSTVKSFVRLFQSLYQGVPPNSSIWYLCAREDEELASKGITEGWFAISDAVRRRKDFNIFLAENCEEPAARLSISRRMQSYPLLSISKCNNAENSEGMTIVVMIKGGKKLVRNLSGTSRKRQGGFVLLAWADNSTNALTVQRFTELDANRLEGGISNVQVTIPGNFNTDGGITSLHIWVASDVMVGIEAEVDLAS